MKFLRHVIAVLMVLAAPPVFARVDARPRNIIYILSDDHRWDYLGFMPEAPKFLETPNLNRLAAEGAHLRNAFVSTSLCSPSRASILTGQYMHRHGVADNQRLEPRGIRYFPEYLRNAGYSTAFLGKWHMGEDSDAPRKGFDYWAGFRGQGDYFEPKLNVNGETRTFAGYSTDVLTDLALDWIKQRQDKPFFLYLSFKAPHFPFEPAPRNRGRYDKFPVPYPRTMENTEANYQTQPRWVRERRFSIHGVDHMETGRFDNDPVPSFETFVRRYAEAVYSVDENVGRLLNFIDEQKLNDSTLIVYMGDNGMALGEHGFYDKRDAFEVSMRIPLLAWAPGLITPGTVIPQLVQNIDIAPSLMDAAGVKPEADTPTMDGRSFWPLLQGQVVSWRDHILYEYYWEKNFPATPTTLAIRTERWKFVATPGIWDKDALYDLQTDPTESYNLIGVPAFQERAMSLQSQLFQELGESDGLQIPIMPPRGEILDARKLGR